MLRTDLLFLYDFTILCIGLLENIRSVSNAELLTANTLLISPSVAVRFLGYK